MIALQKLMKIYQMGDSTVHALDGVSLFIGQGEFVAITGPSGSGKSTLMNILGCLDRPTSGSYQLDGAEVATLNDDQLALTRNKKIGFVFQNFNLLPRISALHNIALPLVYAGVAEKERLDRSLTVLMKVGLAERRDHRPNELSGGQRQRIAIARALVNDPAILIADEPTGNLDTKSSLEIMDIFCDLHKQGRTIIMVTHEPDIAAYAERVVHVRDGRILKDEQNADRVAV
jgi:putative ABC transport system ATP-binding protein